jgi:hypothetical protein
MIKAIGRNECHTVMLGCDACRADANSSFIIATSKILQTIIVVRYGERYRIFDKFHFQSKYLSYYQKEFSEDLRYYDFNIMLQS